MAATLSHFNATEATIIAKIARNLRLMASFSGEKAA
jgi:hypothetical protein